MNNQSDLRQTLLQTFSAEAQDYIQSISRDILALEQHGTEDVEPELLQRLFREAHNLKGSARAVGLNAVSDLAHRLESIFGLLSKDGGYGSPEVYDLAYQGLDQISQLVTSPDHEEDAEGIQALLLALDAVLEGSLGDGGDELPVSAHAPSEPPGAPPPADSGTRTPQEVVLPVDEEDSGQAPSSAPVDERNASVDQRAPSPVHGQTPETHQFEPNDRSANGHTVPAKGVASKAIPSAGTASAGISSTEKQSEPVAEESVRLSTKLLDDLMAHMGELQISRIAIEDVLDEAHELLRQLSVWEDSWHNSKAYHRRLMGQSKTGLLVHGTAVTEFRSNGRNGGEQSPGRGVPGRSQEKILKSLMDFLELNEGRLGAARARADKLHRQLKDDSHRLSQAIVALQDDVYRTRLRPLSTLLDSFPRMVRDLAKSMDKKVRLVIEGAETEVDSSMVQQLKAPLMHLIRNSLDHGIESAEERQALGKDETGTILIQAQQHGDNILVTVQDDGSGISVRKVVERAVDRGIVAEDQAQSLSRDDALWLIFRSGFSTSQTVTDISGRGVGLDVVRDNIENLHGSIRVDSEPGQGTTFSMTLPLSIATVLALLVGAGGQPFAVPTSAVRRILRVKPEDLYWVEGTPVIKVEGLPVTITSLATVLNLETERSLDGTAIVLDSGGRTIALLVDELLGAQELVFKGLPRPLVRVRHIAGVSILGNGDAVPILNAADVVHSVRRRGDSWMVAEQQTETVQSLPPSILVVDDSMTIRTLESSILAAAGYRVQTAANGTEAWEMIQAQPFDLVVSDVQMPEMDGIALTETIRKDERFKFLPVVLITSLASDEDRRRGFDAGAEAYIVKGSFDQQHLLSTVERYTGQQIED